MTCLKLACTGLLFLALSLILALFYANQVFESGELVLPNAPGFVSIVRESDTKYLHIKGENMQSISYGQGFASA